MEIRLQRARALTLVAIGALAVCETARAVHITNGDVVIASNLQGTLVVTLDSGGATLLPPKCVGDCNFDGRVSLGELLIGLDIHLVQPDVSYCRAMDGDDSNSVTPGELLTALDNMLNECPE